MRVTAQILRDKGACEWQVAIFESEWPDGCEVTREVVLRALELELNLDWAARNLLTAPALRAYDEATAPALRAYHEATAPALRAYEEARAIAFVAACEIGGAE